MRLLLTLVAASLIVLVLSRWRARRWVKVDRERVFDEAESVLRFLEQDHGMKCTGRTYDERVFGNVIMTYEKPGLSFQLVRDRSQWLFTVGAVDIGEFSGSDMLRRLGATHDLDALVADRWHSLPLLANVARRNFTKIEQELASVRTRRVESGRSS